MRDEVGGTVPAATYADAGFSVDRVLEGSCGIVGAADELDDVGVTDESGVDT